MTDNIFVSTLLVEIMHIGFCCSYFLLMGRLLSWGWSRTRRVTLRFELFLNIFFLHTSTEGSILSYDEKEFSMDSIIYFRYLFKNLMFPCSGILFCAIYNKGSSIQSLQRERWSYGKNWHLYVHSIFRLHIVHPFNSVL